MHVVEEIFAAVYRKLINTKTNMKCIVQNNEIKLASKAKLVPMQCRIVSKTANAKKNKLPIHQD